MTNSKQFSSDLPFRCSSCLTPSPSLFKQYRSNASSTAAATAASIKLSPCSRCEKNVDPYCEREWLLVILDLVLLRHEAYRHVLYNRLQLLLAMENDSSSSGSGMSHLRSDSKRKLRSGFFGKFSVVLMALGAGFLQACLLWQAREARNEQVPDLNDTFKLVQYHARSFMYLVVRSLIGCGVFLLVLTCSWSKSLHLWNQQHETKVFSNATRLYHAFLLPYSFHLVTLLVHTIWEDTITVLILGSVLVLVYKFMAVVAATETLNLTTSMLSGEETMSQAKGDQLENLIMSSNTITVFLALGTAVFLRAILDSGLDNIFWHPNRDLPCLGFSVNVLRHDLCLMV